MVIQDGTKMSKKDKDLLSQKLARITAYMDRTQERGDRAVERMLDKAIAEAEAEKLIVEINNKD